MPRQSFVLALFLSAMFSLPTGRLALAGDGGNPIATMCTTYCPDAMPTPLGPFRLEVCSGGPVYSTPWGEHVGFGPNRRLNWLGKAHLSSGGEVLRVYRPDTGEIFAFVPGGTGDTYVPFESRGWSDGVRARVERRDDGRPNHIFVTLPDGGFWQYDFGDIGSFGHVAVIEKKNSDGTPAYTDAAGYVFCLTRFQAANGLAVSIAYARNVQYVSGVNAPSRNYIALTDPSGRRHRCYYDESNRIIRIDIESENQIRSWDYSYRDFGRVMTEVNRQSGYTVSTTVNDDGNPILERCSGPDGTSTITATAYTYISNGAHTKHWLPTRRVVDGITTAIDPSLPTVPGMAVTRLAETVGGRRTAKEYIKDGLVREEDGSGRVTTWERHATGNPTRKTDPMGHTWTWSYDGDGNCLRALDPAGGEVVSTYDVRGNCLTRKVKTDGGWLSYSFTYNTKNQMLTASGPGGAEARYVYNALGLVEYELERVDAARWTAIYREYNSSGLPTLVKGPYFVAPDRAAAERPELAVRFEYDPWGNMTAAVNEAGQRHEFVYDGGNRLVAATDPLGRTTAYAYDGLGRKVKETDPTGAYTEWSYNAQGRVSSIAGRAADGAELGMAAGVSARAGRYTYDDEGRLLSFTAPDGGAVRHEYDAAGRLVKTVDPRGYAARYDYDAAGRIIRVTDASDAAATMAYDAVGRVTRVVDPLERATSMEYAPDGKLRRTTDPIGATQQSVYGADGRLAALRVLAAAGQWRSVEYAYNLRGDLVEVARGKGTPDEIRDAMEYDAEGRLVRSVRDPGGLALVSEYHYTDNGLLARDVDPLGGVTRYAYDAGGQLASVATPGDRVVGFEYDPAGRRIRTVRDPQREGHGGALALASSVAYNGMGLPRSTFDGVATTTYEYDSVGRVVQINSPGTAPTRLAYDQAGNLLSASATGDGQTLTASRVYDAVGRVAETVDATGGVTRYAYDTAGQLATVTSADGKVTRNHYDVGGRLVRVELPGGMERRFEYNLAGDLVRESGGPSGETRYEYDELGRLVAVTDANGRVRRTAYDKAGRVVRSENEMEQPVEYEYNANGLLVALVDAKGNRSVFTHDADGLTQTLRHPNGNVEQFAYDAAGRLAKKTLPTGRKVEYTYNAAGAPLSVKLPDRLVAMARDAAGRVASVSDPATHLAYAYDAFGRVIEVDDARARKKIAYEYDAAGRVIRTAGDLPEPVGYEYDAVGRLLKLARGSSAPAQYAYDAAGRRSKLTLPNGVETNYAYDAVGRLETLSTQHPSGPTMASFAYGFDAAGNRTGIAYADGSRSQYTFDDAYRLTRDLRVIGTGEDEGTVYDEQYEYDAVGNRTGRLAFDSAAYGADAATRGLWHMDAASAEFTPSAFAFDQDDNTRLLWHLDESDQAADDTEYLNHGAFVEPVEPLAAGMHDAAVVLDGGGGISAPHHDSLNLGDVSAGGEERTRQFTLELWLAPLAVDGTRGLLKKEGAYELALVNGCPRLTVHAGGNALTLHATDTVPANAPAANGGLPAETTWTHLAVTRDHDKVKFWLDGVAVGEGQLSLPDGGEVRLDDSGAPVLAGDGFAGGLDEVRISDIVRYEEKPAPDHSGFGNGGYLRGNAVITEGGRFGKALLLDGTAGTWMEVAHNPNGSLNLQGDFTIEAWVRGGTMARPAEGARAAQTEVKPSGGIYEKWEEGTAEAPGRSYRLFLDNGRVKFSVTEDGTPETERTFGMSSSEVPGGAWTHVAVTRQGGTLKLWARVAGGGAQKSSTHGFGGAVFVSASPVKIGRGFVGMIDELRLSAVNREDMFCRVQFRYQHNNANQLLTERIGTPTQSGSHANLSVDNAASGATERRYAYDADGNNTTITEYARTGIVNGATGVRIIGESMTYDALGRQTKWHGYTATEHTVHQATGWKRAETIAPGAGPRGHLNTSTYYVYDGDDVALDLSGNLSRGRTKDGAPRGGWQPSRHYATPFLDENVSVTAYATKHLPGWGLTNGRAGYDPEEGVVKHTRINTISTSSTQLPSGHPLSAVAMPSTFYYTHDGLGSVRTLTAHTLNQIASAPVFPASPSTAPPRATGIASHHDYLAFGENHGLGTQSLFGNRYTYTGREQRPSANDLFYRHRNYQPWSGRFASRDPLGFIDGPNIYEYVGSNPNDFIDPYGLGQTSPIPTRPNPILEPPIEPTTPPSRTGVFQPYSHRSRMPSFNGIPGPTYLRDKFWRNHNYRKQEDRERERWTEYMRSPHRRHADRLEADRIFYNAFNDQVHRQARQDQVNREAERLREEHGDDIQIDFLRDQDGFIYNLSYAISKGQGGNKLPSTVGNCLNGILAQPGKWVPANESMSADSALYQNQVTGAIPGLAYLVNGVKFDGYQGGPLLETKGLGYAKWVENGKFKGNYFGQDGLLGQARRQIEAANGHPIEWHFAEKEASEAMLSMLHGKDIYEIIIKYTPPISFE